MKLFSTNDWLAKRPRLILFLLVLLYIAVGTLEASW